MKCRDCMEHLYEYLDRELTPEVEREIRDHLAHCPPCIEQYDAEAVFLKFVKARCSSQGAPPALRRKSDRSHVVL